MARNAAAPPSQPADPVTTFVTGIVVTLKILRTLALLLVIIVVGIGIGAWVSMSKVLPDTSNMGSYRPEQTTKLFSREGKLLGELHDENREIVPLSRIPQHMRDATIAVEDERFHAHIGADPRGILRAAFVNYRSGGLSQGGSTITEQLAENIYLTHEKTVYRRLQEMLLALQIERQYSKDEILALYLNEVCYGHNCFGVQAASRYYFGKDADDLTLEESALLAGLPRAPSRYSPYEHPETALARRDLVLTKMAEQHFIAWDEGERAKREKLKLVDPKEHRLRTSFRAPYFTSYALKEVVDRYGVDLAYKGGLRVYTTLSLPMQEKAFATVKAALKRYRGRNITQCALVCLDPNTGEILALIGGRDWNDKKRGQWNRATQAHRPPGSSFKPYVYAAAIDSGFRPNSTIVDEPVQYPDGLNKPYKPRNYDGKYRGRITLATALAYSVNIPAVKLNAKIGPTKTVEYARRCGIKSPLKPVLSLALGSCGVTLLEHTSAYGVFATGGTHVEPTTILRVTDANGRLIDQHLPSKKWVLNRNTAGMITEMLIQAVEHGTGKNARIKGVRVAGKTGTNESKDVWFMGFTPDLVTGVWIGNDDNSPMRGFVAGGALCAPIWKEFMTFAIKEHGGTGKFVEVKIDAVAPPVEEPDEEEEEQVLVGICTQTGLRANAYCPGVIQKPFSASAPVPGLCRIHRDPAARVSPEPRRTSTQTTTIAPPVETVTVTICADSGRVASLYCPRTKVVSFPSNAAPRATCGLHSGGPSTAPSPSTPPALAPPPSATTEVRRPEPVSDGSPVRDGATTGQPTAGP